MAFGARLISVEMVILTLTAVAEPVMLWKTLMLFPLS